MTVQKVTGRRARGIRWRCRSKYGGSGSDICPAGPSPRLRSDAGLTGRLRLPQLATGPRKQNRIPAFSNARQGGIYRRRRVADPWGTVCREYNVRSALNECRTAYAVSPCNALLPIVRFASFASGRSRTRYFPFTKIDGHRTTRLTSPFRAKARSRCAPAR